MTDSLSTPALQPEKPHSENEIEHGLRSQLVPTEKKKLRKLVSWLRRHKWTFLFVSAAFALAAFIVRDAVRDHLKDLSDRIDKNQTLFVLGYAYSDIGHHLNSLLEGMSHLDKKTHPPGDWRSQLPTMAWLNGPGSFRESFLHTADIADDTVSNSWTLVEDLPDQDGRDKIQREKQQVEEDMRELRRLAGVLVKDNVGKTIDVAFIVEGKAFGLQQDALAVANNAKKRVQNQYTLWTNISYALYGVTLLFALIGKLAGVDAVGGE